jgi:SecD/SecF fusion protein
MQWNPHNMVLNLLAEANVAAIFPKDVREGIALVFALLIGVGAFYVGRAIPRMMVEGKKLLEIISGVLTAVILFWVARQSLNAASWGTILLLVSVMGGVLGVYLGRPLARDLRVRSETWRYVFGLAVFGAILIGFSFLSLLRVRPALSVQIPTDAGQQAEILDAETFTVQLEKTKAVTFELNNTDVNPDVTLGNVRIDFTDSSTVPDVAKSIVTAIKNADLNMNPVYRMDTSIVTLGEDKLATYSLDFNNTGLFQLGTPGMSAQLEDDAASADKGFRTFGILFVLVSLSYLVTRFFVDRIRSPEYTWKIALILTTLSIGVVEVAPLDFKFGVDLKGGVNLIYQLKPEEKNEEAPPIDALIQALSRRINPGGTREMVIRPYGSRQIEIIIPDADRTEIDQIKRRITQAGLLQFRIVANRNDHQIHIELAQQQKGADNIYDNPLLPAKDPGVPPPWRKLLAQWVRVARDEKPDVNGHRVIKYNASGNIIRNAADKEPVNVGSPGPKDENAFDKFLLRAGIDEVEVLMAVDDGEDIVGGDLGVVRAGVDQNGAPTVDFSLRGTGVPRFKRLTSKNRPDDRQGVSRQLGIVLDNDLLSAPTIRSVISERGQITGNFTREEINFLVGILRAGRLPATLDHEPISEETMGAELGEETIRKGKWAIGISLAAVVVFIILYYRFAGVVAVVALATNLLLILALMKLINASFTLPGLAGLVLTVGMSVDANVLIFERIREELKRGSSLRMAIRNGFSRATITIVDANLTTLITAIVLYMIGTDQIRGFAITLILGILMSMYTAIFCSRAVFELLEKSRLLKTLSMGSIIGKTSIDFIGKRAHAAVFSLLIIAIGVGAVYARGDGIYAIDFLGGTSVTVKLTSPRTDTEVTKFIEAGLVDEDGSVKIKLAERFARRLLMEVPDGEPEAGKSPGYHELHRQDPRIEKAYAAAYGRPPSEGELKEAMEAFLESKREWASVERPEDETMTADEFAWSKLAHVILLKAFQDDPVQYSINRVDIGEVNTAWRVDTSIDNLDLFTDFVQLVFVDDDGASLLSTYQVDVDRVNRVSGNRSQDRGNTDTDEESDTPDDASQGAEQDCFISAQDEETGEQAPAVVEPPPAVTNGMDETGPGGDGSFGVIESSATIRFSIEASKELGKVDTVTLREMIKEAAEALNIAISDNGLRVAPLGFQGVWEQESRQKKLAWTVTLQENVENTRNILERLRSNIAGQPYFPSSETIGSKVAGDTKQLALFALLGSLIGIVAYIWFRFQRVAFGLAAVVALVHDVMITLGAIAVSKWVAVEFLQLEEFRISLPVVAAFLTIIGYSLNDTIVVFDRIREVRGKNPLMTREMINESINQTLSRTVLTSVTTLIVVMILFFLGGQGIHGFAFSLVVGVLAGTYSSIFIASPVLLFLVSREK